MKTVWKTATSVKLDTPENLVRVVLASVVLARVALASVAQVVLGQELPALHHQLVLDQDLPALAKVVLEEGLPAVGHVTVPAVSTSLMSSESRDVWISSSIAAKSAVSERCRPATLG